jgi:rare lipoprotein A
MTRHSHRRPAPALRRDRTARRGRHRLEHPYRRRARYAAVGLLALAGGVAAGTPALSTTRAAPPAAPAAAPERVLRPAAARPTVQVLARRAAPVRQVGLRWVTRTVDGRVLRGRATWYGPGFDGHRTASGDTFDSRHDLTAAHLTLPFGTRLRVCYRTCVMVRINDRGPYGNAILDLSWLAASRIGLVYRGIGTVTATVVETRRVREPDPVQQPAAT